MARRRTTITKDKHHEAAGVERKPKRSVKSRGGMAATHPVVSEDLAEWGVRKASRRAMRGPVVALARGYSVATVADARKIVAEWLRGHRLEGAVDLGLPEVDDRYHVWRVPLIQRGTHKRVGEAVIDARTSLFLADKTTKPADLEARILGRRDGEKRNGLAGQTLISYLRDTVVLGDCEQALLDLPTGSVDLIFTSPPYYNARPEYEDYFSYEEYLLKMRRVVHNCRGVLAEGRFFVINVSPVLVRRASRNHSSTRLAVPFDLHRIFTEEGYDFVDDIIWEKPEGAGWATGRGRRFAADRSPLQYKPVPVTEYVLVYRKHTDKLIDWNIRNHPDQAAVEESKVRGDYDVTNIWRIPPAHSQVHPAVFPLELAEKVVRYYSFKGDVVLDPFAGIGTTGKAAALLGRRFVLIENEPKYVQHICSEVVEWLGAAARDVLYVNCEPPDVSGLLPMKESLA